MDAIVKYLNKYYYVKGNMILRKQDDHQEWGFELNEFLGQFFSISYAKSEIILTKWVETNGVVSIKECWGPKILNFSWSLVYGNELIKLGVTNIIDAEINYVIDGLAKEIDVTFLREIREKIKYTTHLADLIKCIGYDTTNVLYNEATMKPQLKFLSMKYHDIVNERQSNDIWQDYIRPTRVNDQTQVAS